MQPIDTDLTEPVAPEPSAPDAAGSAISAAITGPSFPWRRALMVVLIIAISVASPALGSFTVLFAVAVLALGLLRGGGNLFVIVCGVGAAVLSGVVASNARIADEWTVPAVAGAILAVVLGLAHRRAAQPDPSALPPLKRARQPREQTLAQQMAAAKSVGADDDARDWPEPRADRGVSFVTYAWLVASIVLVAIIGGVVGTNGLSDELQSTVKASFADYDKMCSPGGELEKNESWCRQVDQTQDFAMDAARDHAPAVLAIFASLALVGCAWLAHLIVITRARALESQGWHIATRPRYRLRELEFDWGWAYVGVVGVVGLIASRELDDGALREWSFAAAAGLTSVAAQVIAMQGTGLMALLFTRRPVPKWYWILLVVTAFLALPFVLGALLIAGALDMWLGLRRRLPRPTALA